MQLPDTLLQRVLRTVVDGGVLAALDQPHLLTDMYVRAFAAPAPYNLVALNGMFTLIHEHNVYVARALGRTDTYRNYPDFYTTVYQMIQPEVCYSPHREKFFQLLNLLLSST
jgi:U3 small nucleolar RNA-associated protein 19